MLGVLRRLARLRGPAGVLALAVGVGLGAGLLATHLVLAAWTYRDGARRDLRAPRRWALAVLVGGLFAFVPYVLVQRAADWSSGSRGVGAARRVVGRGRRVVEPSADTGADDAREEPDAGSDDGRAASGAARYGWTAVRLGGRGARWAAARARRRLSG